MSIERFLCVCFPLRAKQLADKSRMIKVLIGFAVFQAGLDAHFFWTIHLEEKDSVKTCKNVEGKYDEFL